MKAKWSYCAHGTYIEL